MHLRLVPRDARPARCPYCRLTVIGGRDCYRCKTLYHDECAKALSTCALLGCEGNVGYDRKRARARRTQGRRAERARPARTWHVRWRRVAAVAGLLTGIAASSAVTSSALRSEAAPIGQLKTIGSVSSLWRYGAQEPDDLDYGTLTALDGEEALINEVLSQGTRSGYAFQVDRAPLGDASKATPTEAELSEFHWATPAPVKHSDRYFTTTHEGVIFYTTASTTSINSCTATNTENLPIDFHGWKPGK